MSDKPKKEKKEKPKKEKKAKKEKLPKPSNNKVKVCPECKSEIPKKASVCPHCAAKQRKRNPLPFVLPMLLVVLLGAALSLFGFHYPIEPPVELPFDIPILSGPKISDTPLGKGMELTAKQEEAMKEIFDQCGLKEIVKVDKVAEDLTTTSYAVQDGDTSRFMDPDDPITVRIENEDKTVRSIIYQNMPLYANDTVVGLITDHYMDMSERDVYMQTALVEVKARLDLPEVAVFPSRPHWTFTEEEGGTLVVESFVTTKDGTGKAQNRPFRVLFQKGKFQSVTFLASGEN